MRSSVAELRQVRGSQEPRFLSLPPGKPDAPGDFGDRALQLAELAGLRLDPWQQVVLRAMLRTAPDSDRWAAYESLLLVPRQNGKSLTLEAFDLAKLFLSSPGHLIMHTAHQVKTAMESFRHLTKVIKACPELDAEVDKVVNKNGAEGIELKNGSRLLFAARGVNGSGRGFSPDDLIFDEAYRLPPEAEEAMTFAISARQNPQLVYASSTGYPDSVILWAMTLRGRAGGDPSLMFAEWSSDPDLDLTDEATLIRAACQANPALGYRLDLRRTVAEYRKAVSQGRLEGFSRERLGQWAEVGEAGAISMRVWDGELEDERSQMERVEAFALETGPDRAWTSIGAAGRRSDRLMHVELLYRERGTEVAVALAGKLAREYPGVPLVVDVGGPAQNLIPALEREGVTITPATTRDVAAAYGMFMDAVRDRTVRHGPDELLREAVESAKTRPCGDGGEAFGRRISNADISALVAVNLAHWAATSVPEPYARIRFASDLMPTPPTAGNPTGGGLQKPRVLTQAETTTLRVIPR